MLQNSHVMDFGFLVALLVVVNAFLSLSRFGQHVGQGVAEVQQFGGHFNSVRSIKAIAQPST